MKEITEKHDQAMVIADNADAARARGESQEALRLYREAFTLERAAADATAGQMDMEPTRSILHRSAASLAMQIKEFRECERLVCIALAGNPPSEIADELREIWEQASFSMHLSAKSMSIGENELFVSMWGRAVGYGYASCAEVVDRLGSTQKLLYRTAERLSNQPYRDKGEVTKTIRDNFHIWASVPKAASYGFALRVGSRESQEDLFEGRPMANVISEVMDCVDLVAQQKYEAVERRIPNKAYFRNFIGLTGQIAPKGREVTSVGFAARSGASIREVIVVRPRRRRFASNALFTHRSGPLPEPVQISGRLLYADARSMNQIQIEDAHGIPHDFIVPVGLMADVVRPYFEKQVTVHGIRRDQTTWLDSIEPFEERIGGDDVRDDE